MSIEIKIPELGENIHEGDIVSVAVQAGDTVSKDQPILEIETGKATIEVPSSADGRVMKVLVKPGDKAKVGQPVILLEDAETATEAVAPEPPPEEPAPASVQPAPTPPPPPPPQPVASPPPEPASTGLPVAAAPTVRRFAREIGIDIREVPPSRPGGRIVIDDVKKWAKQILSRQTSAASGGTGPAPMPLPDFSKWGPVRLEAMNNIRRTTAEHMARCWAAIPHVTQHDQADITQLEELRKRYAPRAEKAGGKLTMTAMLMKVVASALKNFPKFNASIDMAGLSVVFKDYIHIGVAVDTPRGLVVPVIRDTDTKNMIRIAVELSELAAKAREGKLAPDEMSGGTFTLTNLGGIGGSFFTPIVNAPEVAILGVGRGILTPSFSGKEGCCAPRLLLPLSLSYDHRLIDGADGARFLRWIVEAIEEPLVLSLEG